MKLHRFGVGLAVVVMVAAVAPAAFAQDKKALKKIEDANAKAMEEYDLLEFESAKKLLNGALVEVKRAGLDKHPIAARTHGNLGIVYEGLGDPDNALLEFISALEIDAKWSLPKEYKKPELTKIFDSAKSTVGKGGKPTPGPGGDDEPPGGDDDDGVTGFKHSPIDDGKEGQPVPVSAQVGSDVGASQVVVYYRPQGQEDFTPVTLKPRSGSTWAGAIPASATKTDSIQYYIEAKGDGGKVLASAGSRGSPNIIEIARTSGGGPNEPVDDENPLGTGGGGGDENGVSKPVTTSSRHTVYVNIAVGSGAGFLSSSTRTEQSTEKVQGGFAPAPFHIMPELGFWLSPKLTLSLYGRIGMPIGANIPGHAPAAPAGLVRLGYHLAEDGLAFHGDLGGGFLRHTVTLNKPFAPDMNKPKDTGDVNTVASGPVLVGGGVSWSTSLSGTFRFLLDLNVLAGVPVVSDLGGVKPEFAVNADLNIGLQLAF